MVLKKVIRAISLHLKWAEGLQEWCSCMGEWFEGCDSGVVAWDNCLRIVVM